VDIHPTATHQIDQLPPAICSSPSAAFTNSISQQSALQALDLGCCNTGNNLKKLKALSIFYGSLGA
jgi:hypothetical protein